MLRLLFGLYLVCAPVLSQVVETTNYIADDGHARKEVIESDGTVRGEYSYNDPNGKKITVKYSAGKDGFKVEGDHLPKPVEAIPPQPQYNPTPQYQPQPYQHQQQGFQQQQQGFQQQQQAFQQPQIRNPYQFNNQPPTQQYNYGFQTPQQSFNNVQQPSFNHFPQQSYNKFPQQSYNSFPQQQYSQQSSLPVPQLPSYGGPQQQQSAPAPFFSERFGGSQSSSLGSLPAGTYQNQPQQYPQQYSDTSRSATVNVSQQPGNGIFSYNINS